MARRKSTKTKPPIESYRHADKERVNNPPVGLVTPDTDPDAGPRTHAYDSHLDERKLQEAVQRIVAAAQPRRIILFGSYGRGDAAAGSDLDLMVIERNVDNRYEEMIRLRKAVGHIGTGVDVLVYSEVEVEERKDWCTSPIYWALREGRTLYAAQ